jgi:Domain of unknown function (DUF4157)
LRPGRSLSSPRGYSPEQCLGVPLNGVRVHGDRSLLARELSQVVQQRPPGQAGLQRQAGRVAQEPSSQDQGPLNAEIAAVIDAEHGHGHPIPGGARADLEQHLGAQFSAVRLHTGPRADVLSRAVRAEAFTTGTDVFFRSGMYDPVGSSGRRLLAHELTHVVQRSTGKIGRNGGISQPTDAAEVQANEVARMFDQEAVADAGHGVSGADACCGSCGRGKSCETTPAPAAAGLTISRQATVSPGGPSGPDPCFDLLQAIIELLNEVAQRFNDAINDPHDLFKYHRRLQDAHPDYGSWDGHRDRYNYDRGRLREKLAEWKADDQCGDFKLSREQQEDLTEAEEFADKDFPAKPAPSMRETQEPELSVRERTARALRDAGVPAWAIAGLVVLVIAAIADPEPFSKVAMLIGAAAAIAFFILIGHRDAVPGEGTIASAGDAGGSATGDTTQPPESVA